MRFAGAFFLPLALLAAGCGRGGGKAVDEGPRVLELDSATIPLPDSVRLVVITLDRSVPADMDRPRAQVRVGDIVRFEAKDGAGHAVAFDGAVLPPDARAFLESTGQLRSPPLVAAGNAWVVTFARAPAGEYPFQCVTHGGRGSLQVTPR